MDHKVSKDMISSGMIPSGEKTQADLGRTQYGSAPSPSKLMDAYKSMYGNKEEVINEHHQKDKDGNTIPHEDEEIKEGKMPAGLQAYLDKKKGKKEDKKDMKEGIDLFDVVSGVFVAEGYEEKDAYKVMSQLTEEQLNEIAVTGTIATLGAGLLKGMLGAGKMAAVAGKGLASAGKAAAVKGMTAAKSAASGLKSVAKTGMTKASDALGKVSNIAKDKAKGMGDTMSNVGKSVGDEVKGEIKRKIVQGNDGGSNTISKTGQLSTGSKIAASADLFDIVKGQLLDEGLSEEEIKDIMLSLTPDEIMSEMNAGPSTPVKNYGDSPDKPKILPNFGATRAKPRTTDKGTLIKGGKDTGKTAAQMSQEEYKNFDPKKPDPKQMAVQAKQEKNKQKFNDPMGVKNKNIGGQGLDPMDK